MKCIKCSSYAVNHHLHGRDGTDPDLCDVCFWRKRAQRTWVGLTNEDKCTVELAQAEVEPDWIDGYKSGLKDAEEKLKEKNT